MLRLAQIPEFRDKTSTSPANTSPQSYMIRAMIAGERDPQALACGRMKARHGDLVEALDGMFDDHHGKLAQILPGQIAFPDDRIGALTTQTRPDHHARPGSTAARLAEVPHFPVSRVPGDLPARNPRTTPRLTRSSAGRARKGWPDHAAPYLNSR